jgi:hypothetical protein
MGVIDVDAIIVAVLSYHLSGEFHLHNCRPADASKARPNPAISNCTLHLSFSHSITLNSSPAIAVLL